MYCTKCGYQILNNARFCIKCGRQIINVPLDYYEYVNIKVAGVSFYSGNESRQKVLQMIKDEIGEFKNNYDITLGLSQYEGRPAVEIYVNKHMIGYVPKSLTMYIYGNYQRIVGAEDFVVYGGGEDYEGNKKYYGAELTIKMRK